MRKKHPLLTGALILTLTGVATRILGFFYKIFLSRVIGAEGLGIYQMIFPIFGICVSLTIAGIETSISRFVAGEAARGSSQGTRKMLSAGLFLSFGLSLITAFWLYHSADFLAVHYLKEPRCGTLLRFLSFSLPFCACHSCICGYYFGLKKTGIPAASQLLEQIIRVGSVFLLARICMEKRISPSPVLAVLGLAIGEFFSMLFCVTAWAARPPRKSLSPVPAPSMGSCLGQILRMSLPLTGNRVVMNLLTSIEAVLIPLTLQAYGLDTAAAYSVYGTLTGMSLSFIMFPSVITSSISVLLLPSVSELQAAGDYMRIQATIRKALYFCIPFGSFCTIFFLATGKMLGTFFFHSALAGDFIITLAWICPFLYLNSTLNSVLHGLGRTSIAFRNNILGITIRILFILLCIPSFGIQGYLWGLLANQLAISLLCLGSLREYLGNRAALLF